MSPLPNLHQFVKELKRFFTPAGTPGIFMLVIFFFATALAASAQTITWTERFVQGAAPSQEQCQKWGVFLSDLGGKQFASVTMRGEFDPIGRTITDPAAATKLADLLHKKEEGVVIANGHTWRVTHCDFSVCQDGRSISLSVDGAEQCSCSDLYTLRPQSKNGDWGGVNTGTSCGAKTQSMTLEFHSGVSIIPQGPAFICEGKSVDLKAESKICLPVASYQWTNEAGQTVGTGQIFTASEAGLYSVTVTGAGNCSATSAPTQVATTDVTVDAGLDVVFCSTPLRLNAMGTSVGGSGSTMVNNVCIFDAFGLFGGNCKFPSGDICMDGSESIKLKTYSQAVSFSNPVELRYKLYHSARSVTEFLFLLNGNKIGSYTELKTTGACTIIGEKGAPFTFKFTADKFKKYWLEGQANTLAVSVSAADNKFVDVAGIAVEVVTSDESYNWSPAEGLDVATIKNPVASPAVSTTYTVTYKDPSGCIATDEVVVKVCAPAPTAVCQEVSVPVDENSCTATVDASKFDGGSTSPSEGILSFSASPAGPYPVGTTEVTLTVTDLSGSSTCKTKVTVTDAILPEISTPADLIVDNDDGECFATIALELPEASDNCEVSVSKDFEGDVFPVGETIVTWTASDASGNKRVTTQKVNVLNASPVINSVESPTSSIIVNDLVTLIVNYSDNNIQDATIDWADGSAIETVVEPAGNFEVSHTFIKSGSYAVHITLTDKCGGSTYSYTTVVVSNPRSGSVSGGGWFNSPRGAYVNDPNASGKATFAFEASNVNRNRVPGGHIVFNFHKSKLKFRSTHLERLRLEDNAASIWAVGRLNGKSDYQILLSVAKSQSEGKTGSKGRHEDKDDDDDDDDDDNDDDDDDDGKHKISLNLIRVKIWDPNGNVIYDTQLGSPDNALATTQIHGGSVKLKDEELFFNAKYESPVATSSGEELSSVYPNPFTDWVDVEFSSGSNENVSIQVMEMSGKVIFNEVFPVSEDGRYPLDIPEREKGEAGIYLLVIKQGKKVEVLRLVRN